MKVDEAVRELARIGFRFYLTRGELEMCFEGAQPPEQEVVYPLLEKLRKYKDDAVQFLKLSCAHYGGCRARGEGSHCEDCGKPWVESWHDEEEIANAQVELIQPKCGSCANFKPDSINPSEGFGLCLNPASGRSGAFPGKQSCQHHAIRRCHGNCQGHCQGHCHGDNGSCRCTVLVEDV